MEEDIIDKLELLIMETKESAFPTYWSKENAELVENLIKGYKELVKENINLNDELQMTKNSVVIGNLDVMEDYIPKSKLREIIEDIDNNMPVIAELKLRKLVEGDK